MSSIRFAHSVAVRSLPFFAATTWGSQQQIHGTSCDEAPKKKTFQKATCTSNARHTHDTRLITLKLPSNWNESGQAVANVLVRSEFEGVADDSEGSSKKVARPYNPLSATSGDKVTLLVKRYGEDALMGSKLHGLKPGDEIEVKGPNKQWSVPPSGKIKKYVMIAGGTGVTPIMQATQAILENDEHATVEWYTFNKTFKDCLLVKNMVLLKAKYPGRFFGRGFVETTKDPQRPFFEAPASFEGKPTLDVLAKVLPLPTDHDGDIMVCVCGRPGMTAAVAGPKTKDYKQGELGGILKALGFTESQVWKF